MATFKEHIYAVKNILERGVASDDSRLSERFIGFLLKTARTQLIKEKINKYREVSPLSYQTVCIPLELTTYHDCSCIPADIGCKILKSTCHIPRELVSKWGTSLTVFTASGRTVDMSSLTQNDLAKFSETNQKPKLAYFIENQHLYILNSTSLKVVLLSAIWEDPEEVKKFCKCNNGDVTDEPCYDPINDDFPIDSELARVMRILVTQELQNMYRMPEDNLNNGKDVDAGQDKEN